MRPELQNIYKKMDNFLFLPGKEEITKLLCAFAIGCKLPVPPPWLFLASGSSTGKTEIISLMELVPGYFAIDDMTNNALLSGMKKHDQSASLLHRVPPNGFLVFSDFTTMLAKRKEDLSAILGQLRIVFDGKASRATGGLESEIKWKGKLGMLAACTTALYTKTEDYAEVGQRMVIYHMLQPDNYEVGRFKFNHAKDDRPALRLELQTLIQEYVASISIPPTANDLPEFDKQTQEDILDIGHLAVSARSPVSRNKFSRDKEIESIEDPEGIGRVQGQLMTIAYGLMLQNTDGVLHDSDRKLLYKIGLDCIDPRKRSVLRSLTEFGLGGDLDQISNLIGYPKTVTERFVEDLVGLGMVERKRLFMGQGNRTVYSLKDQFKDIMRRFEGITVLEEELPEDEENKEDPFRGATQLTI